MVQKEGDRVDEEYVGYTRGEFRGRHKICGHDGPVRVRGYGHGGEGVVVENAKDCFTDSVASWWRRCDARGNGEGFYSEDTDVWILCNQLLEEWAVGPESNLQCENSISTHNE